MRYRTGNIWIVCVIGLAVGCVVSPEADKDRGLYLEREDLEEYGIELTGETAERSSRRVVFVDGSYVLEYLLQGINDDGEKISIDIAARYERTAAQAMAEFMSMREQWLAVNGGEDGPIQLAENFYHFGDESFFAFIVSPAGPLGNLFVCRLGCQVYSIVISGAFCDDPCIWDEMVGPKLRFWSIYQPIPGRDNPSAPREKNAPPKQQPPLPGTVLV